MPVTRRISREEITYEEAKSKETNILHKPTYWDQRSKFLYQLYKNRTVIQAITFHHLGLTTGESCRIAEPEDWLHGSFNLCIPIIVLTTRRHFPKRVIIRFPLPYKVGELFRPGNADEKIRCEAGTYAWLQQHCPSVPIPRLYGFGLSTGQTVRMILVDEDSLLTWTSILLLKIYRLSLALERLSTTEP